MISYGGQIVFVMLVCADKIVLYARLRQISEGGITRHILQCLSF